MDLKLFVWLLYALACRVEHKVSDLSEFSGFQVYANRGLRPLFGSHLKMAILGQNGGFLVDCSACGMVFDVFWAVECIARVSEGLG